MKIKWIERSPCGDQPVDLARMPYKDLKELAKEKGIPGYNRMSADALRAALGGE